MSERVSRTAFLLYILFLQLASAHHLLADPGLSTGWKVVNTSYFMYFAVLASMIHGLTIPGAMEVAQRAEGLHQGPVRVAAQGALEQPDLLRRVHLDHRLRLPRRHLGRDDGHRAAEHDHPQHDLRAGPLPRHRGRRHHADLHGADLLPDPGAVPARDDPAQAGEVAALPVRPVDVLLLPGDDGRRHARRLAPALGHGLRRHGAGLRMARRGLPDDGAWSASPASRPSPAARSTSSSRSARCCGASRSTRGATSPKFTPIPRTAPSVAAQTTGSMGFAAPGTFMLAMVFLLAFVLYYFINWKYLSTLWGLS